MDERVDQIRQNIEQATGRIRQAAQVAGRDPASIGLVIVTKSQPVEVVRAVIAAGGRILGENYPEETRPKILEVGPQDGLAWHMIGHLQSRKSAIVAEHFDMLESLDSLSLAQRLDRQLAERERILPVLLELNVSGEETKYGWPAWQDNQLDALFAEIEQIVALPQLAVRGLMTMPPWYDDPEKTRPFFARLRQISEACARRFSAQYFNQLSMGTSVDYEAAVMEGATLVRIGTAIVGARIKPNSK